MRREVVDLEIRRLLAVGRDLHFEEQPEVLVRLGRLHRPAIRGLRQERLLPVMLHHDDGSRPGVERPARVSVLAARRIREIDAREGHFLTAQEHGEVEHVMDDRVPAVDAIGPDLHLEELRHVMVEQDHLDTGPGVEETRAGGDGPAEDHARMGFRREEEDLVIPVELLDFHHEVRDHAHLHRLRVAPAAADDGGAGDVAPDPG